MTGRRKTWSRTIEQSGIAVRVYERAPGGLLYREVRYAGRKDRKSLGHHDRTLALGQARAFAQALGEQTYGGTVGPPGDARYGRAPLPRASRAATH